MLARQHERHVLGADGQAHSGADLGRRGRLQRRPATSTRVTPASRPMTHPVTIVSTPTKRATSSEAGAWNTRAVSSSWQDGRR